MTTSLPGSAVGTVATRCWTLSGDTGTVDVEVTAAPQHRLLDVLPVLGRMLGRPVRMLCAGGGWLTDETPLSDPALDHGAVLGLDRQLPRPEFEGGSTALELRVIGGPDAGRSVPLGQGRHVIGRGGDCAIRLPDPDVSRRHATVRVGGGAVTVADLASSNGSRLDDEELTAEPLEWSAGAVLRLGASALTLAGQSVPAPVPGAGPDGRRQWRPAPRFPPAVPDVEIRFPQPPTPAPRRRLAWAAVALPAVAGVTMAWLLHTPTFLFFALLSPVVALGTWLSDRWSGRRSGRRETLAHAQEVEAAEALLVDAVRADLRAAEDAHPDLAALAAAARRRTPPLWSRARQDEDALAVRIGSGPGPTRVIRVEAEGTRAPASAPHVPVVADLRATGGLAVVGPRERTAGVLRSVVAQLCTLHAPGELDVVLVTPLDRLASWRWTRWLPHLDRDAVHLRPDAPASTTQPDDDEVAHRLAALVARRRAMVAGPAPARPGWLLVVVDGPLDARSAATLRAGRDAGLVTVTVADDVGDVQVEVDALLRLTGETGDIGVLTRRGAPDRGALAVDRLPAAQADRLARDLAALTPATSGNTLPRHVRLVDMTAGAQADDLVQWSRDRDRLVATVGRTADAPVQVDLCRQGPHALVAGTTGSGKSELLQTLIAGLALNHPPDRCSFLLVDYKGGAAFAEAASLPHTVGLVTDLDGQTTARALRSLGAELTRREAVLAAHGVADIASLPAAADLARLVIVVDEFAGLSEELPEFVPGLVAIAQRGRSLGVHLVLATQRPSGVVSPEIRANCSLRICLRTTDEAESRDVLGTPDAAHLPLEIPGRAWLRSGSAPPTALQVARVAGRPAARSADRPTARRWVWPAASPSEEDRRPEAGDSDLARMCRVLADHCRTAGVPTPHRPWRPPLADRITPQELETGRAGSRPDLLPVALVDRPEQQSQDVLELDLAEGGTWLVVGGPRSGRTTLLRTVLGEAAGRLGPDELHVHVLEAGAGPLSAAADLPHTGTVVNGEDALRTVRLVDRLAQEVAARRAGTDADRRPRILLLVDGVEAVSTLLDESDPGRGSASLLRLMRDGGAAGLTCVATADRAVPGGRLAAVAQQRLVLPLTERADYAVAGIPTARVPGHRPPGRALVGEDGRECQIALPRPIVPAHPRGRPFPEPLRVVELPSDPRLPLPAPPSPGSPPVREGLVLPVGPGGDEGRPLTVDLHRTGGLLVTGPPGSGRTSALTAFAQHLQALGAAVLLLGPWARSPEVGQSVPGAVLLDGADTAGVDRWLSDLAGRRGVVVADDVGAPAQAPALLLPALGSAGLPLIAAAHAGQLSSHYQGPVAVLRRGRSGLLLCPGPGDAEVLGVRLPRTPVPQRPGSGWLVSGTALQRVQVARRRPSPPAEDDRQAEGHSSSSAEPISCRAYQASS
ncbi:FtsK/SpoIIIE domain-containing protein [Blastococcus haudaquaticus]|uniref:DNA segregation ATPase FtsK/SpoIIIE, S-DNA-T family n=1 Tax=Blastococcus haudaquaticus TaxID=1938745 RepID=A0A286GEJ2_9ACTN|nr:FtsK/SpoIIIE domain-containing protein [Blastococcus haudaquaticus]SOD93646.1 DNA segregation ATPase FtsK/SpoIIIE, S-DNA-T family [Blastococcus haudaquaticus]